MAVIIICAPFVLFASAFTAVLVHEAGHLTGGIVSGYRFSFFEVFGITIVNRRGRVTCEFHRGMPAGQCLMGTKDPDADPEKVIAGGLVAGAVFSAVSLILAVIRTLRLTGADEGKVLMIMFFLGCGVLSLIITVRSGSVRSAVSDGATLREVRSDTDAKRAYNRIALIASLSVDGVSLSKIPSEIFGDEETDSSLGAELALLKWQARAGAKGFDTDEGEKIPEIISRYFPEDAKTEELIMKAAGGDFAGCVYREGDKSPDLRQALLYAMALMAKKHITPEEALEAVSEKKPLYRGEWLCTLQTLKGIHR